MGGVQLGAVTVDCPDPAGLGDLYKNVLDLEVMFSSADFVALQGAGVFLTFHRVADHQCPTWPNGPVPKQLHLELRVWTSTPKSLGYWPWELPRLRFSPIQKAGGS